MSTIKIFIIVVIVFVIAVIILVGPTNPFSFGAAYFMPRNNPTPAAIAQPSYIPLLPDRSPTEVKIDR